MKKVFYGWKMLPVLWLAYGVILAFPFFAGGVINAAMASAMHLNREALGGMAAAFAIGSAAGALPVGAFGMRFGGKRTILLGGCIMLVMTMALAQANSVSQATIAFGLLALCPSAGIVGTQSSAARWFVRKRGMAIAIIATASAVGGVIFAPTVTAVIARTGVWQNAWWIGTALAAATILATFLFVRDDPASIGQFPDGAVSAEASLAQRTATANARRDWALKDAMKAPAFWLILAMIFGTSLAETIVLGHAVAHLRDLGHSAEVAAGTMAGIGAAMLIGKIGFGYLADRIEIRILYAAALLLMGASFVALLYAKSIPLLAVTACSFGTGYGAANVLMALALINYFGVKPFPMLLSICQLIARPLAAIGVFLAGLQFDVNHSYTNAFLATAVICVCAGVSFLSFGRLPGQAAQV